MTGAHASEGSASEPLLLDIVAGKAAGFGITVDQRLVIGRQSEGAGCLADDLELSRHHAEISCESGGEYTIKDLSSTNGTFVNGERLNAPAVLHTGDSIEVGGTTLVVRAAPQAPAPVATPPVDVRAATVTVSVPAAMREYGPEAAPTIEPEATAASESEAAPAIEPEAAPVDEPEAEAEAEAEAEPAEEPEAEATPTDEPETEATPAEEPEAEATPAEQPEATRLPLLELRVVVDVERGEAQVALEEGGEAVRVRLDAGRWQFIDRTD